VGKNYDEDDAMTDKEQLKAKMVEKIDGDTYPDGCHGYLN